MIRPDLIFSYWVFVWWFAYLVGWTTFNPKFATIIGIIENIATVGAMIYIKSPVKYILFFSFMFVLMKGIPYYTVRNAPITKKDVLITFFLFTTYLVWCEFNNFRFYKVLTSITTKKYDLPGMVFLDFILKH